MDPTTGQDAPADLLVADGRIAAVGADIAAPADAEVIDAAGMIVSPAWIDVHVHLRQPGFDAKETITTGTIAAVAGGFMAVACMPNTRPALDSPAILDSLAATVRREARCRVYPIASITRERALQADVDYDAVIAAGAIGWSDDGDSTPDSAIMRRALEASRRLDRPVIVHCEDKPLAHGAMHEGEVSRQLGIPGIPAAAEEIIISRDLMLAELTGGWLHVCHVSTGRGIELIHQAKERGVRVTAEVMPHHLMMSDRWVAGDRTLHNTTEPPGAPGTPADPNTKVNPPLRPVRESELLLAALKNGWFDCFGTDHAPHALPEKSTDFAQAAFGMTGIELAAPLTWALVRAGHLSAPELVRRWTVEPARILGIEPPSLTAGAVANITVFDPDHRWTVTPDTLATKSKNTPLLGMELRGKTRLTIVDGKVMYRGQ